VFFIPSGRTKGKPLIVVSEPRKSLEKPVREHSSFHSLGAPEPPDDAHELVRQEILQGAHGLDRGAQLVSKPVEGRFGLSHHENSPGQDPMPDGVP
jgi:hypothetical protein